MRTSYLLLLFLSWHLSAAAQTGPEPAVLSVASGAADTDSPNPEVRRYKGKVKLKHQGMSLFGDRATHQVATRRIEAVGHVLIIPSDSVTIRGDSVSYDGATRQVSLVGHVTFQHRNVVITATRLDYDVLAGVARYVGKGRVADGRTIVARGEGWYSTQTKRATASRQVSPQMPKAALYSDSVRHRLASATAPVQPTIDVDTTRKYVAALLTTAPVIPKSAATERKLVDTNRPLIALPKGDLSVTNKLVNPAPAGLPVAQIPAGQESVGTYSKTIRSVNRPVQASRPAQPKPEESDLERLLNQKKQRQ